MIDYCYTPHCLRNYILHYFGEEMNKNMRQMRHL